MKRLLSIALFICIASSISLGQQDPEAKNILDRAAERTKQYTTIKTDFSLKIENRRDDFSSSTEGVLMIKGEKYYMESSDTKVYYNGTTLWTFMEDINEVTISEIDEDSEDFVENPVIILEFYNRDFKYRLAGEVKMDVGWVYEIDLYPKDLDQPYSSFKVMIKKDNEELYLVKAVGKDGIDYTAKLENTVYDLPMDDATFVFPKAKHKGVEVVDMRP
ncbi:MAG: outer membrane lipoprotein carrier protein LolA [Bacteroidales bacterium]|nr:outer membrane lipoprotein carrier protein LolA [Bacteroidales bacterium]